MMGNWGSPFYMMGGRGGLCPTKTHRIESHESYRYWKQKSIKDKCPLPEKQSQVFTPHRLSIFCRYLGYFNFYILNRPLNKDSAGPRVITLALITGVKWLRQKSERCGTSPQHLPTRHDVRMATWRSPDLPGVFMHVNSCTQRQHTQKQRPLSAPRPRFLSKRPLPRAGWGIAAFWDDALVHVWLSMPVHSSLGTLSDLIFESICHFHCIILRALI